VSVEAFQARLTLVVVVPLLLRLAGVVGAVVSGGGVTVLLTVTVRLVLVLVLLAASRATAVRT